MKLTEQLQEWNENDEYQKIIDAIEGLPDEERTPELISDLARAYNNIAGPALHYFEQSFREKTTEGWSVFEKGEARLRALMDQKDQGAVREELIETCSGLLSAVFSDVSFELGFNGKKYELILTPEGKRTKLFELVYFQSHAPSSVLEHWNILVGRQPSRGYSLGAFGEMVSGQDVQVWIEKTEEQSQSKHISLELYCEKLLPLFKTDESKVWWLLSTLLDQILGELAAMELVEDFQVLDTPKDAVPVLLDELPEILKKMDIECSSDPEHFLENSFIGYEMVPDQNPEADWRLDVFAGSTRCAAVINEYLRGEGDIMDEFHRDGVTAGFLCYPLDSFAHEEERGRVVLDFRDELIAYVLQNAGDDAMTFLGGATSIYCGYLDFIAWDLNAVLASAAAFFENSPVEWAAFHSFRRNVNAVRLMDKRPAEAE